MPIVPVLAIDCLPPFDVFRLGYVEMLRWGDFGEHYRAGLARLREAIDAGLVRKFETHA